MLPNRIRTLLIRPESFPALETPPEWEAAPSERGLDSQGCLINSDVQNIPQRSSDCQGILLRIFFHTQMSLTIKMNLVLEPSGLKKPVSQGN